jgi:DNA-directed RNA polymerase sigma subunit (sigma70/sigma32)
VANRAAQLFDETRSCRLNTFAYRIVNQHVITAAAKASTIMSMGDSTLQTLIRVRRQAMLSH